MSIWASLEAPDDERHEDGCAIYRETDNSTADFKIFEFSGDPCSCGQPDAPLLYQGSHVLPSLDDERGGHVDMAIVLPHVRFWRENPDADPEQEPDLDTHPIEPFLRLGVNEGCLILTRPQVQMIVRELQWFLQRSRPQLIYNQGEER